MTEPIARPVEDTAPCVGCGLCCNGTLFARAKVTPGEEPTLLAHGLTLITREDRTYFQLPCHHESCGRCTIYAERFDICRSFRCALLRRYQGREISLPEARATVEKALELLASVKADEPAAGNFVNRQAVRRDLADVLASSGPEERGVASRRLLNIIALDSFLDRWFRNRKVQTELEVAPLIEASNS